LMIAFSLSLIESSRIRDVIFSFCAIDDSASDCHVTDDDCFAVIFYL